MPPKSKNVAQLQHRSHSLAPLCSDTCSPTSSPAALLDKRNRPSYARQGQISLSRLQSTTVWPVSTHARMYWTYAPNSLLSSNSSIAIPPVPHSHHRLQRPATFHQRSSTPSYLPTPQPKAPTNSSSYQLPVTCLQPQLVRYKHKKRSDLAI